MALKEKEDERQLVTDQQRLERLSEINVRPKKWPMEWSVGN